MLLGDDNIADRYITPTHGVYHSDRHFMLYNHSIYMLFCIEILIHGVLIRALLWANTLKKEIMQIWLSVGWKEGWKKVFFSFLNCFLIMSDQPDIVASDWQQSHIQTNKLQLMNNDAAVSFILLKFHCTNLKCYSVLCMTPCAHMHTWQHWGMLPTR